MEGNQQNQNPSQPEPKKEVSKGPSWFERNWQIVFLVLIGIFFFLAYLNKFLKTQEGTLFTVISCGLFGLMAINMIRKAPMMIDPEAYVKPPEYYWNWFKEYNARLKHSRTSINLTWTGNYIFHPTIMPELIYFDVNDTTAEKQRVLVIRVSKADPSFRGIIPVSWEDFLRNKVYRYKMAGFLPVGQGQTLTIITKDGRTMNIPADSLDMLQQGGIM